MPPPQVVAFCDVDEKKIKKGFYCYEESQVCGSPGGFTGRPQDAVLGLVMRTHCPGPSSPGKATRAQTAAGHLGVPGPQNDLYSLCLSAGERRSWSRLLRHPAGAGSTVAGRWPGGGEGCRVLPWTVATRAPV